MSRTLDRERWQRVSAILDVALELDPDSRRRYIDDVSRDDADLRADLQNLLAAEQASVPFLNEPAAARAAPLIASIGQHLEAGSGGGVRSIGAYRLVRCLGEGGMGIVHLAERIDGQFEQHVAIKVMQLGLRSEESRRRFLRERQILARLQHPAIAR